MKHLLLTVTLLALAGCDRPPRDPVWDHYHNERARGFIYTNHGWKPSGRAITQADIDATPCVVLRDQPRSQYNPNTKVIHLRSNATMRTLLHERQHHLDCQAGITDSRELERRAMLAESDQEVK